MNEVSDQDHFSYFLEKLKIHLDLFSEQNEKVILENKCYKFGHFGNFFTDTYLGNSIYLC